MRDEHGHRHRLRDVRLLYAVAEDLHVLILLAGYVLAVQGTAAVESRGTGVRSGYVERSVPRMERVRPGQVEGVPGL